MKLRLYRTDIKGGVATANMVLLLGALLAFLATEGSWFEGGSSELLAAFAVLGIVILTFPLGWLLLLMPAFFCGCNPWADVALTAVAAILLPFNAYLWGSAAKRIVRPRKSRVAETKAAQ